MRTEIFTICNSHSSRFMLFGGEIERKGHGFSFQDVIAITACPSLFLLLNMLVTITRLMSVCAVMRKFLLIFFEL
jgi:hypothetical protein